MKKVDLMIFDLDGTLVDSAPDLISAVNYTRAVLGLPAMNDNEIISFVGDGTDKLVERLLGQEFGGHNTNYCHRPAGNWYYAS